MLFCPKEEWINPHTRLRRLREAGASLGLRLCLPEDADESCSATTLRRDEWIETGVMDDLEQMAREVKDRAIGLDLFDVAVDCCITKAPCGEGGQEPGGQG